ncbi:MAG: protein kinase [Flavobacteriaceae bacterium]|nr:protein kinase [Flavobacteriaceae bacterium]
MLAAIRAGDALAARISAACVSDPRVSELINIVLKKWNDVSAVDGGDCDQLAAVFVALQSLEHLTSGWSMWLCLLTPDAASLWIDELRLRCAPRQHSSLPSAFPNAWRLRDDVQSTLHRSRVVLGDGASSTVFAGTIGMREKEIKVAVKVLTIESAQHARVLFTVEAAALALLRHPGIITFFGADLPTLSLVMG